MFGITHITDEDSLLMLLENLKLILSENQNDTCQRDVITMHAVRSIKVPTPHIHVILHAIQTKELQGTVRQG